MPLKGAVSRRQACKTRCLAETSEGASTCSGVHPPGNVSPVLPCLRGQPTHAEVRTPYSCVCQAGAKAAAGAPVGPCSALGSRRARKGWSATATSVTSAASSIVHMGGSRRDAKARGVAQALRSQQPAEGASEAPEDAACGKAAYRGKGARELTRGTTHSQQHSVGKSTRPPRWAGWEREPADKGRTASGHAEGGLLESRVRCKSQARFGGGDGGNGP